MSTRNPSQENFSAASPNAALDATRKLLNSYLIGSDDLIEKLLICLLADGHILIEGAPGLGKTRSAKLLAKNLDLSFARIQCTPDLMPADITGTSVWRPDRGVFEFLPGPIFHSLLLVDEINRAPPKVQSALLEAMAEKQATVAGETRALPSPFMTIATQNPIEQEGTFPLPEAQLDRFMLHVELSLPDTHTERQILDLLEDTISSEPPISAIPLNSEAIMSARKGVRDVFLSPAVKDYIVRLVTAPRDKSFSSDLAIKIDYPASPRGTLALAAASKARAYLSGRDYVLPDDIQALAVDALSHRTILSWQAISEGLTPRSLINAYLERVMPT